MAAAERSRPHVSSPGSPVASRTPGLRLLTGMLLAAGMVLLSAMAVLPTARRWNARERQIETAQVELQRLANVVTGAARNDSLARAYDSALATQPRRVLRARSRALAASALQSLVAELAEISNVTVTRLDVASVADSGDVPITLAANGDIFGLADLLRQLRVAKIAIAVDKLQVQNNSALRGAPDVLQLVLTLHAPVIVE